MFNTEAEAAKAARYKRMYVNMSEQQLRVVLAWEKERHIRADDVYS